MGIGYKGKILSHMGYKSKIIFSGVCYKGKSFNSGL